MVEERDQLRGAHVLVLGSARQSLVACRDLAAAGAEVFVARRKAENDLVTGSRSIRTVSVLPDPQQDLQRFTEELRQLVVLREVDVVLPAGDEYLAALSAVRDDVPAAVPLAPHQNVLTALDKVRIGPLADAAGLPVPTTHEATEALVAGWEGPAVVKDQSHWNPGAGPASHLPAVRADDGAELAAAVARMRASGGRPVLQALAGGRMLCFSAFRDRVGVVSGRTQQTSDHLWPVPFGTTARATTTELDPAIAAAAARLLESLDWLGWVNLQLFRQDDGTCALIDVNGRFNHSMALVEAAGVHPARAWARMGLGIDHIELGDAKPGVRLSLLVPDLKRARHERRGGTLVDVAGTLAFALRAHHTIPRVSDPWPAVRYLAGAHARGGGS